MEKNTEKGIGDLKLSTDLAEIMEVATIAKKIDCTRMKKENYQQMKK